MNNKKTLILLALILVLLIGGAFALYSWLGGEEGSDQLLVLGTQSGEETTGESEPVDTNESEPADTNESEPEETGEETAIAPDFTVYDAKGNAVSLSDYFGKPIVLNFWASWCGPCQSEMPDFQEKYLELGEEVTFLMVNMTGGKETLASAMGFISKKGYTFPVFYDTAADAAITYGVYSLPTTYFLNAKGEIVAMANGAITAAQLAHGISLIR